MEHKSHGAHWHKEFFVPGIPRPKGSMRAIISKSTGRAIAKEDNKSSKDWQKAIAAAAKLNAPQRSLNGAVELHLMFHFEKPTSAKRPSPSVRPDLDKLCRAVLDALTKARMYDDDGQVCQIKAEKRYSDTPGVHVTICALEDQ